MNFSIRHAEADRWTVIDADDTPVYTGSLRECEDWLDRHENATPPKASLLRRLMHPLGTLFRAHRTPKVPPAPPQGQSEAEQPADPSDATRSRVP